MSFGEELRRERELRKISLREIAESTKISVRYLDALERNDFQVLPGGVFNRGFVRAYAQHIGVDPEAMVNAYLLEERAQRERRRSEDEGLLRGRSRSTAEAGSPARKAPGAARAAGAVALMVLGCAAAGLWLWLRAAGEPREEAYLPAPREASGEGLPAPQTGPPTLETAGTSGPTSEPQFLPQAGVELYLERPTRGRFACDGKQVEILDGMPAGSRLPLDCQELIVDAEDAGALVLLRSDGSRRPVGEDGQPVRGLRVPVAGNAP